MLNWTKQFNIFCLLDNHGYQFSHPQFECLLAAGAVHSITTGAGNAFTKLEQFADQHDDWVFGQLAYDLKNEVEDLRSENHDGIGFPDLFFFVPEIILILQEHTLQVGVLQGEADEVFRSIDDIKNDVKVSQSKSPVIKSRFSKEEYINSVEDLREHIHRGDCYEINFCQEFYAEHTQIDPYVIYEKLGKFSPNPFAAFYKNNDRYLLCSSPERYLKKVGNKIFSQPIKGTSRRDLHNIEADSKSKENLSLSPKERSENVMVVDLVRNDLSKICVDGTVKVEELFGIYSFPQVHQMISTVSGTLEENAGLSAIFKATFPMGSMTGAPKKSVMQLIEKYERTRRGLFSGAIGYIDPSGNFDFNVVIRSILYNDAEKYISIQAGSAITFYSDAEKEYEECLLKIEAMKKVLE
jgi:para-aminobenzoate synthetase component 1